jgi:hypothetical protein
VVGLPGVTLAGGESEPALARTVMRLSATLCGHGSHNYFGLPVALGTVNVQLVVPELPAHCGRSCCSMFLADCLRYFAAGTGPWKALLRGVSL